MVIRRTDSRCCRLQVAKLQEACKKAEQEAEEQAAALHAAQLELQARVQSTHADIAGQKQATRALQKDLREALSEKASLQQQVCVVD